MKIILTTLLLLLFTRTALAQTKYSDRCVVSLIDMTGIKASDLESDTDTKLKSKELGIFDTVIYEEELTTKAFRLPGADLFVVASVWYTDESMGGEDSQDSMSLGLAISRTPKHNILFAMQYAEAEVLMKYFEVARVTTIFKTQKRSFYIQMECRKGKHS